MITWFFEIVIFHDYNHGVLLIWKVLCDKQHHHVQNQVIKHNSKHAVVIF